MRAALILFAVCASRLVGGMTDPMDDSRIDIWYGDRQEVGHLGSPQPDFNLLGHVSHSDSLAHLAYSLNDREAVPLSFHAFRRLVDEGDFNADIPVGELHEGANTVSICAEWQDGQTEVRSVVLVKKRGQSRIPYEIRWSEVDAPQMAGQVVDGLWRITPDGLRTCQVGYDRVFLIGERDWKDYEVRTSVRIHKISGETSPVSGGNGLGIICRFAGHVIGGFMDFPQAQPKWGYLPFGAIGWLRWPNAHDGPPYLQFYPGGSNKVTNHGRFSPDLETSYSIRMQCRTLPDSPDGDGVTRYSFKLWPAARKEPADWTWTQIQTDANALRQGGVALVAHHVDATFGNISISSLPAKSTDD